MEKKEKYTFEKLTPFCDTDISIYESAIDFVFGEEDVRNVALSGAYGAGKSSVLASYKKQHPNLKFVHISLAHFQSQDEKETDTIKESILEGKILNQLIHQIPSDKIPQTNFRVKKTINKWNLYWNTVAITVFLLATLHIVNFDAWGVYVSTLPVGWLRNVINLSTMAYARLVSGVIGFAILCVFVYQIIKTQKNRNIFKKLSFQGNEIEIFEETEDSYFDKYLNEVLYLFERIEADVIVFEDMDRFKANRIFERLREINTLVNQQRTKDGQAILRFFYLLRDDIFVSKDRTKFFECIIPVVPVVDGSNSYNQFISHLKKNELFEKFDDSFLQGISLYVDDMRLLKNVCNEFLIYYNRLNTTKLDYNKMLALIVYKNLFPRDFCDLQLNKGFVYSVFNHKEDFIADEVRTIEIEIGEYQNRIETAKNEQLINTNELDIIFKLKKNPYTGKLNSADQASYDKRKQAILDLEEKKIAELENAEAVLQQRKTALYMLPLAKIITRENIDQIFTLSVTNEIGEVSEFKEIKGSDYFSLLKYLIRNGFIDETYADYMTYFYEDSLSRVDKIFLRSITDKKAEEYGYQLKSPQLVLARMRPSDFDQEESLNFDLTNYIMNTESAYECVDHLIHQLKNSGNYSFISQYFDVSTNKAVFVDKVNCLWPEMFTNALKSKSLRTEQIKEYSLLTIYFSAPEVVNAVNAEGELERYISNSPDYLNIESPQIEKIIKGFQLLGVSFRGLEYDTSDVRLFHAVYKEGLYDLTFENIQLMLQREYNFKSIEDIQHRNYTLVLSNIQSPLHQKILADMSTYIDLILENCGGKISDKEQVIREILNSDQIEGKQKECYIECVMTPIVNLCAITDKSIWAKLIRSNALQVTEENIMDYFLIDEEISDDLVEFINRSDSALDFSSKKGQYSADEREALFDAVVRCSSIENTRYAQMLSTLGFVYNNFDVKGVHSDKLRLLIDCKIIKMNVATLVSLRINYPDDVLYFISVRLSEYIEIIDSKLFSHEELLEILDLKVKDEYKMQLLEFANKPISIEGKAYSIPVRAHILRHNLEDSDMKTLFCKYSFQEEEIKRIVFDYAVENVSEIIENGYDTDRELIHEIFKSENMIEADKLDIVIALLPRLNQTEAIKYFQMLGLDEFVKVFDTRLRPTYRIEKRSEKILSAFLQKGWLYEYLEDDNKPGFYKVRRTQPPKLQSNARNPK